MIVGELPRGLRYVVVYVDLVGQFPPPKNSEADIALLRAANLSLRREGKGSTDSFLFVSIGNSLPRRITESYVEYGFPKSSTYFAGPSSLTGLCQLPERDCKQVALFDGDEFGLGGESCDYFEEAQQVAETAVKQWLESEHPGAIAFPGAEYDSSGFWWVGIERSEDVGDWTIGPENLAPLLPEAHVGRAATWLSILWPVIEEYGVTNRSPYSLGQEYSVAWVAGLSAWLHGFEAASGNDCNGFDADAAVDGLALSPFFLGFEAARLSGEDLESFSDSWGAELEELPSRALGLIIEDFRSELRSCLSTFFGGDVALFFALHSAIWPRYGMPMGEALDAFTGADDYESLAELDAPWSFVTNGWCDEADQ